MTTTTILQLCLLLHLTGLVMFAGLTLANLLAYENFWKQFFEDKAKGIILFNAIITYRKIRIIGAVLLIATGISMMLLTHGVYNKQIWMQIKMSLVILLALTGPFLSAPSSRKLKAMVREGSQSDNSAQLLGTLKKRISLAINVELILLITVVLLSVFKFN